LNTTDLRRLAFAGAAFAAVGLAASAPAFANDFNMNLWSPTDMLWEALLKVVFPSIVLLVIEAAILKRLLGLVWKRALWCAVVANVVSLAVGALWYVVLKQPGWKTVLVQREWEPIKHWGVLGMLFVRSYVITVAEESVVVALLLGKGTDFARTAKAVALANAVSYVLCAAFLLAVPPV